MHTISYRIMISTLMIATLFALPGCDTEPSEQADLSITPNNATIRLGQSQEFTVTGLQDYTWEIVTTGNEPTKSGILSARKGNSTVYTAISGTNEVVALRVTANVRTSSETSLDPGQTTGGVSAEAIIQHQP
ncbi:MAG: hypothetical protein ACNA71_04465 [Kiritimatiellia bacterium]